MTSYFLFFKQNVKQLFTIITTGKYVNEQTGIYTVNTLLHT